MRQVREIPTATDDRAPPSRPTITWDSLVVAAPELLRFQVEAVEAAQAGFVAWLGWVAHYFYFKTTIEAAATVLGARVDDCMATAKDHLAAVFERSRRRIEGRR
jgi:hypothetical protein